MEIDKTQYQNCTYVFAGVLRPLPSFPEPSLGWVEVGGDPASSSGKWIASVIAKKRNGFLGGYSINEDTAFPSEYSEVDRAFTLKGARDKVIKRTFDLAHLVSEKLGIPVVDFEEAQRHKDRADKIAVEKILAKCQR